MRSRPRLRRHPATRRPASARDPTCRRPGLRPADVAAYARAPETSGVDVALAAYDGDALAAARRARADLDAARERGRRLRPHDRSRCAAAASTGRAGTPTARRSGLWRSHAGGLRSRVDDAVARGTMLVRLHQLLRGGSGVDPALVAGPRRRRSARAPSRASTCTAASAPADLTALAELGLTPRGRAALAQRVGAADAGERRATRCAFISSNAAHRRRSGSIAVTGLAALARSRRADRRALPPRPARLARRPTTPRVHAAKDDPHAAGGRRPAVGAAGRAGPRVGPAAGPVRAAHRPAGPRPVGGGAGRGRPGPRRRDRCGRGEPARRRRRPRCTTASSVPSGSRPAWTPSARPPSRLLTPLRPHGSPRSSTPR